MDDGFELDAEAQKMLDALRAEEALPDDVHNRVWGRVDAEVSSTRVSPWPKIALVAVAAAAAVVLLIAGGRILVPQQAGEAAPVQAPRTVEPKAALEAPERARTRAPAAGGGAGPELGLEPEPEPEPEPELGTESAPVADRARARARARARDPEREETPDDSLGAETKNLARAQAALVSGNADSALFLLGQADQRFRDGALQEERAALRVVALCDAGRRADGLRARARFLKRYPSSAVAGRVRGACAEP